MKQFLVQYIKDFRANFYNFNAYIILGGYCLLSFFSALYLGDYFIRESNVLNSYFSMQPIILMLIIPAITMRSWADEIKSGTLELLLSLPISYLKLTFAKFMAALSFFVLMMMCSLPFFFLTSKFSILDTNVVFLGYVGMFLCGALFTIIGCLVSAFNRNIILCYISTIFAIFFVMHFEPTSFTWNGATFSLRCLVFEDNYNAFLTGVINWRNILYFVVFISFLLWLNTVTIKYKKADVFLYKKQYGVLFALLFVTFCCFIIGSDLKFKNSFDLTNDHKFTLSPESRAILDKLDKRIDITLYESKTKREDATSSYAVYADYVEKIFKLIEHYSEGLVRTEFVRVEPFSAQERHLINNNTPYEDDKMGYKVFMAAELSDNEGHHLNMNAFSNLRQNLLEADIMRLIQRFGVAKKDVAIIASNNDWQSMEAFNGILEEFYNVEHFQLIPSFLEPSYNTVIVVNPMYLSSESLLAMEQYVLNGGNLMIFYEPLLATNLEFKVFSEFMRSFGIKLNYDEKLVQQLALNPADFISAATLEPSKYWDHVRRVIVNGTGTIDTLTNKNYEVFPILYVNDELVGAVSIGSFISNYLELAAESDNIEPISKAVGKVFFFYDTDLLKNYLYVSEESKSNHFYEIVPTSDNMLFFLNLMDFSTSEEIESTLSYRHFALNRSSIGHALLRSVKSRYSHKVNEIQKELDGYLQQQEDLKALITGQGFASAKNFENIGSIAQNIDEKKDELNRINALILNDYQSLVLAASFLLIFIIPAIILLLLALCLHIIRKMNMRKIERIVKNA